MFVDLLYSIDDCVELALPTRRVRQRVNHVSRRLPHVAAFVRSEDLLFHALWISFL